MSLVDHLNFARPVLAVGIFNGYGICSYESNPILFAMLILLSSVSNIETIRETSFEVVSEKIPFIFKEEIYKMVMENNTTKSLLKQIDTIFKRIEMMLERDWKKLLGKK